MRGTKDDLATEIPDLVVEPPTKPDENGVYPVCAVPGFTATV